jgi:ATP-dependent helicase HrpB
MKSPPGGPLPIDAILGELLDVLSAKNSVVLQAAPGAGKSTRVPLALLETSWLGDQRVVMLEPRRLATRAVAERMAFLLNQDVGDVVGYRMRGATRVGKRTRVEVVTEGVLSRMLLQDPTLDGIGILIFDEFHERSLNADVGLALALQTQQLLRVDLRLLVMSATLDSERLARMLDDAPVVTSASRGFPIDIRYFTRPRDLSVEAAVARTVRQALHEEPGSILAFLPGSAEIRRCVVDLETGGLPAGVDVMPLYGDLTLDVQSAAIRSSSAGRRKVVLATSIAETSLTIEGVRVVIDAGFSRVSRFAPQTGMSRLETVRVSRMSAEQRAGRAGRTEPGVCYRLWAAEEHASLLERARPEILETDLAPLALDLAVAGVSDVSQLRWLDVPPAPALAQARELLRELGALDSSHRITPHGRSIASLGLHPRIAHMLTVSVSQGFAPTACAVAAILEERDFLRRGPGQSDPDLRLRVERFVSGGNEVPRTIRLRAEALRSVLRVGPRVVPDVNDVGRCVALAYPDRVAQQRGAEGRYRLRNGVGAVLPEKGSLSREEFLAIVELDGRSPDARIFLAAPLDRRELLSLYGADVVACDIVEWRSESEALYAVRQERLGALVLHEGKVANPDADVVRQALVAAIRSRDARMLQWSDEAIQLRERIAFLRSRDASWPDWSEDALLESLEEWLAPHLENVRRASTLHALPLHDLLLDTLRWEQRRELDRLAPTHVTVPTGSRIRVDYHDPSSPRIAVRLQEMFGLADGPRVFDGRVPLTIELLSPAHRPVQVTTDLAGFWKQSYFEVRKELRGRYPKHEWPEDPLQATPTRRAKPRR